MNITSVLVENGIVLGLIFMMFKYLLNKKLDKQNNDFIEKFETIKSEIQLEMESQQEIKKHKRELYIKMVEKMVVFIDGRVEEGDKKQYQNDFLQYHDIAWLWASEEVLINLASFIESVKVMNNSTDRAEVIKEKFSDVILAIRKDLGLSINDLNKDHYKFVTF